MKSLLANIAKHKLINLFFSHAPLANFAFNINKPSAEIALAVLGSTKAFCQSGLHLIELIVKRKLFIWKDVSCGEHTDTGFSLYLPFTSYAVWIATMIDEPSNISLQTWVNPLIVYLHQIGACARTIQLWPRLALNRIGVENLTNVLDDKIIFLDQIRSSQTPTFVLSWKGVDSFVLPVLESSILAHFTTWANIGKALLLHCSILTFIITIKRN